MSGLLDIQDKSLGTLTASEELRLEVHVIEGVDGPVSLVS